MSPEAEYSSSRRFITTGVDIGEARVLAGVVDVRVRVQDVADVATLEAVLGERGVESLSLADVARSCAGAP